MTSILGRMATYSGKIITMADALARGRLVSPVDQFHSFDDTPPVLPNEEGFYPVPVPGKTQVLDKKKRQA